jgi:hypothetical protein
MRRLAPLLLVIALTACGAAPLEVGTASGGGGQFPEIGPRSLEKWASFPVEADPRPLVLLGERVIVERGFTEGDAKAAFSDGRIDPDGRLPPEAAEAFAQIAKPAAGEPKIKVISVVKGTAKFMTDRGQRALPAWVFELTQTLGPVGVLAVKPDYEAAPAMTTAIVSGDGMTLTVPMLKAYEPCPGEPRTTYEPQWLESPTAVAVGLKPIVGEVAPGEPGNCAHDLAYRTADYMIRLDKPLGNRVVVGAEGNVISVSS